jgi:hypothetical protein
MTPESAEGSFESRRVNPACWIVGAAQCQLNPGTGLNRAELRSR